MTNAQVGWDRNKRDAPHEQQLEDEALALRRSGMTYDQIAKHQGRGRDKIRNRIRHAEHRTTGPPTCPTCGQPLLWGIDITA